MIEYLFDTTQYHSVDEFAQTLKRELRASASRSGVEAPEYELLNVATAEVATLWDGTLFISGVVRFTGGIEGTTQYLAAFNAMQALHQDAPGGIRIFEYLDTDDLK